MKVELLYKGETFAAEPQGEVARLGARCPLCGANPCLVAGTGMSIGADDRHYRASAVALCCDRPLGELRAYPDTLFGLEEDERVLFGRCRVY